MATTTCAKSLGLHIPEALPPRKEHIGSEIGRHCLQRASACLGGHGLRHSFVHSGVKPYGCGHCGYASAVFSNLERHVGTAKCRRNAERIAAGLAERPKPKGIRVLIPDVATMIAAQALLELGRQARVFKPDRP
ncbi:hypothetical protein HPB52_005527 [Rhipicephalus sanguineus]|uniref:Zinc finger protein n=1 Tax=Rhipicephalus sanguineus TaxID=34632 RepID=A0A9D4T2N3_RHISA|nr:hypothetical protein HPB52_005527 [Rhipicephalus sanguineus]